MKHGQKKKEAIRILSLVLPAPRQGERLKKKKNPLLLRSTPPSFLPQLEIRTLVRMLGVFTAVGKLPALILVWKFMKISFQLCQSRVYPALSPVWVCSEDRGGGRVGDESRI